MNGTKRVRKSTKGLIATAAILLVAGFGCGDDGDDTTPAGSGGSGGSSAGSGGSSGSSGSAGGGDGDGDGDCSVTVVPDDGSGCINAGDINPDCTAVDSNPPFDGSCAPRGPECHRASNIAKECGLEPDAPVVMEFRVNQARTANHPNTSGRIWGTSDSRAITANSEQSGLIRVTLPRAGGELTAGMGTFSMSAGQPNCDGTYSYYGPNAAPARDTTNPADHAALGDKPDRWAPVEVDIMFDPSKTVFSERYKGIDVPRTAKCGPFYIANSTDVDWEGCPMGQQIDELDITGDKRDGNGVALSSGGWDGYPYSFKYHSYLPIFLNDSDIVDGIGASLCHLFAFGIVEQFTCSDERCEPDSCDGALCPPDAPHIMDPAMRECAWLKVPDSLCPEDDAQAAIFGCHVGAQGNINKEEDYPSPVDCTMEAPTARVDDEKGQCCDPLGKNTDGLPACNAFRVVTRAVLSAAEIQDAPKDEVAPASCSM